MIIGVDPHKRSHTATAVDAVRKHSGGFVAGRCHPGGLLAFVAGGRVSSGIDGGRLRTPEVWVAISLSGLLPRTRQYLTRRPQRPPVCVSYHGAGDARTT